MPYLPTTARGVYKLLISTGVFMGINAGLSIAVAVLSGVQPFSGTAPPSSSEPVFYVGRVADAALGISFACWWCLLVVVCSKARGEEWIQPFKGMFMAIVAAVLICQTFLLAFVCIEFLPAFHTTCHSLNEMCELHDYVIYESTGHTCARILYLCHQSVRVLRLNRLVIVILLICWGVLFCRMRRAVGGRSGRRCPKDELVDKDELAEDELVEAMDEDSMTSKDEVVQLEVDPVNEADVAAASHALVTQAAAKEALKASSPRPRPHVSPRAVLLSDDPRASPRLQHRL